MVIAAFYAMFMITEMSSSPIIAFEKVLVLRMYSDNTIRTYLSKVQGFIDAQVNEVNGLTLKQIEDYFFSLIQKKSLALLRGSFIILKSYFVNQMACVASNLSR